MNVVGMASPNNNVFENAEKRYITRSTVPKVTFTLSRQPSVSYANIPNSSCLPLPTEPCPRG